MVVGGMVCRLHQTTKPKQKRKMYQESFAAVVGVRINDIVGFEPASGLDENSLSKQGFSISDGEVTDWQTGYQFWSADQVEEMAKGLTIEIVAS